ncbi:MAG: PD-(D/E)XK nuclease family protein [Nevskiales bacterium]
MSAAELVLTASDRLARELRAEHSLAQRRAGHSVWEAPPIHSLRQWVLDQWLASWPVEQLLHPVQELILWQDAIADDARQREQPVLSLRSCAREARRADHLIRAHDLRLRAGTALNEDQDAFQRWRRRILARCRDAAWVVSADLYAALAARIRSGTIAAPSKLTLAGFVAPLPAAENALLAALEQAGTVIQRNIVTNAQPTLRGWRPADARTQFQAIARALRERLLPCVEADAAPPRLILALGDPDRDRELVETVFREELAPWLHQPGEARIAPWRWESGRPLTEQAWVDAALAILRLERHGNAPADVSRLLLSSSLWTHEERQHTAALDHHLRDRGWPQLRLTRLLDEKRLPSALQQRFRALETALRNEPRQALPSSWARYFEQRLETLGWPGSAQLGSAAYQIVTEFRRALDRLATLDTQLGAVPRAAALGWLEEVLRATRLEPRTEHEQPILILRHADAVGLPCDALFLADATADILPGAAQANPFLPWEIQAAAGLPEAAPASWLRHRQQQLDALLQAAGDIQIYAPHTDATGAECLPSPLLPALQWQAPAETVPAPSTVQIVWPEADPVPPVREPLTELRHRDAGLFRAYAEAPFFAFVGWRLGAAVLPQPGFGLDSRTQGIVLHAALNSLWQGLHTDTTLRGLDEAALMLRITEALAEPFERHVQPGDFGAGLVRLERARLADLLRQWLQHEQRRVDAFTVELREEPIEVTVSGLPLLMRIDRVDQVQTQSGPRWLVLDYKTGRQVETRGWKADSLKEPQLPLYASHALLERAGIARVDGICFAHLKDGHPALEAWTNWRERLVEEKDSYFQDDWDVKLAAWRSTLEAMARGFLAGEAALPDKINDRSPYAAWLALAGREAEEAEE